MTDKVKEIQKKIVAFATRNIGSKVGEGECYDLANEALKEAGAKRAKDFGKITKTADYVWGDLVATAMVQPGDILQFSNFESNFTTNTAVKVTFGKDLIIKYNSLKGKKEARPHGHRHQGRSEKDRGPGAECRAGHTGSQGTDGRRHDVSSRQQYIQEDDDQEVHAHDRMGKQGQDPLPETELG